MEFGLESSNGILLCNYLLIARWKFLENGIWLITYVAWVGTDVVNEHLYLIQCIYVTKIFFSDFKKSEFS